MLTNKDIRVENGNLVLNGDKFPLDGQSPEAIMQIVKDNSDTTPTENSNNPVKSGGVFEAIAELYTALSSKSNTGIYMEGNSNITITSARRYDTIIVVGGFGSTVVFDVMFVNETVGSVKLASQGSTITSIDSYSFKYKPQSEFFQGRIFSINNAQLTIA